MKVTERRIVMQDWYKTDEEKIGWETYGWKFLDDAEDISYMDWIIVDILKTDTDYNPTLAVAEKITEIK